MADEIFAERLELLMENVRNCAHAKCPVNLTRCCEQIHAHYIWLKMNKDPLSGQFEELLHKAQDALSDIKQHQFSNHINF